MKDALRQVLTHADPTAWHAALDIVADLLGELAPSLPKTCPCGYRLVPKRSGQVEIYELGYGVGWQTAEVMSLAEGLHVHSWHESNLTRAIFR